MATNRSFDAHKAVILERVLRAWERCPGLTLGELLDASCIFGGRQLNILKDRELCEEIERFALLGTGFKTLEAFVPPEPDPEPQSVEPITVNKRISEELRAMCYHGVLRIECPICGPKTPPAVG